MISLTNLQAKIASTQKAFESQTAAKGGSNLVVDGSGNGNIKTSVDDTIILLADGDDLVVANSNNNTVKAESGNNSIYINGNKNYVKGGKDVDTIVSIGQNNDLNGGDGDDVMLSIGNNNKISGDDGNNYIAFKGNHLKITDGKDASTIRTLDFSIRESDYFVNFADYLNDQVSENEDGETVIDGLTDIEIDAGDGADDIKVNVAKDLEITGDDVKNKNEHKNIFVVGDIRIKND